MLTGEISTPDHPDDLPDDFFGSPKKVVSKRPLEGEIGFDPFADDDDIDPERITACSYWRCEELFEMRTANHQFCRKACRSRQRKWERSQERKIRKAEAKAARLAQRQQKGQ